MSVIFKAFIHAILLAAGMNLLVMVLTLSHADVPIILRILAGLGHWHYLTFAFVAATVLNRQLVTMTVGLVVILLCVAHQPSFKALDLIFPIAGGILLGLGVQAALQEAAGPPKPPPPPMPPGRGGP